MPTQGRILRILNRHNSATWSEKFTIQSNTGNVGIGTASPDRKLQVNGAARFTTSDYVASTSGSGLLLDFGAAAGNTYTRLSAYTGGFSAWGSLILQEAGKVGIGTTSPNATLEVKSNVTTTPNIRASSVDLTGAPAIELFKTGQAAYSWRIPQNGDADSNKLILSNSTAAFPGTPIMTVNPTGNVGIGTASPLFKLHVKDSGVLSDIRSEANDYAKISLKVNNGGTDQKAWQIYAQAPGNKFLLTSINDAENAAFVAMEVNRGAGIAIS